MATCLASDLLSSRIRLERAVRIEIQHEDLLPDDAGHAADAGAGDLRDIEPAIVVEGCARGRRAEQGDGVSPCRRCRERAASANPGRSGPPRRACSGSQMCRRLQPPSGNTTGNSRQATGSRETTRGRRKAGYSGGCWRAGAAGGRRWFNGGWGLRTAWATRRQDRWQAGNVAAWVSRRYAACQCERPCRKTFDQRPATTGRASTIGDLRRRGTSNDGGPPTRADLQHWGDLRWRGRVPGRHHLRRSWRPSKITALVLHPGL